MPNFVVQNVYHVFVHLSLSSFMFSFIVILYFVQLYFLAKLVIYSADTPYTHSHFLIEIVDVFSCVLLPCKHSTDAPSIHSPFFLSRLFKLLLLLFLLFFKLHNLFSRYFPSSIPLLNFTLKTFFLSFLFLY